MHKFKPLVFFLLLLVGTACSSRGVMLSDSARVSLITCAPGPDLYSAFGHTGIRVIDYKQQFDIIFNYGTFDFNQPGFYMNFIRGKMLYMLSVDDFVSFMPEYVIEKRKVTEQELDLTPVDRQQLFLYLYNNSLPENREYYYDFFWDNCATRPRDVFEKTFAGRIQFDTLHCGFEQNKTMHDMLRVYVHDRPWVDAEFDIVLGLPNEVPAYPRRQTFLPDYLAKYIGCATLDGKPFVKNTLVLLDYPKVKTGSPVLPIYISILILAIGLIVTWFDYKRGHTNFKFDFWLFFIAGLLGVFFVSLWIFTSHYCAPKNLNNLWLIPTHIIVAFFLLKKQQPEWVRYYFLATAVLMALLLIFWKWNPQPCSYVFMPLIILLGVRAFGVYIVLRSAQDFRSLH